MENRTRSATELELLGKTSIRATVKRSTSLGSRINWFSAVIARIASCIASWRIETGVVPAWSERP